MFYSLSNIVHFGYLGSNLVLQYTFRLPVVYIDWNIPISSSVGFRLERPFNCHLLDLGRFLDAHSGCGWDTGLGLMDC